MTHLIDKDKIEEILRNLWKKDDGNNSEHRICFNKALQEVQCEIDTLEVKEAVNRTLNEIGDTNRGKYSSAATAGDRGTATSRGTSAVGENGLAVARGNNVKVKGGLGALLVIAEEFYDDFGIKEWKAVIVDGEKVKADTWYTLKDGELVEVEKSN